MVDVKALCHLTILLLTFGFMLVHCSLEPTDQFIDNPTDAKQDVLTMHKRPSFFVGSRYGRSSGGVSSSGGGGGAYAPSKTRRLNVVPRNDRFFLGSRYGKRAGTQNTRQPLASLLSTPYEQALFSEISSGTQLSNKPAPMSAMMMNENYNGDAGQSSANTASTAYMSCIYTGLQNFYRCNSIDDNMFYVKNTVKNDAGYNDDDGDDDDDRDDDDNDVGNDDGDVDGNDVNDDDINEVFSTDAAAGGVVGGGGAAALAALINDADIRNDVDVKN